MLHLTAVNTTLQLLQLRSLMISQNLSAYIVPIADSHFGERIAACDQRLRFISGFSGSAGSAIITLTTALLWTDGRYFTQANEELNTEMWTLMKDGLPDTPSPSAYLVNNLTTGSRIGVDPNLYSKSQWDILSSDLKQGDMALTRVDNNLIDLVWADARPSCPSNPVIVLEDEFTGQSLAQKLENVRKEMVTQNAEALIVSELDEIAWMLNLRGSDLPSSSVFIAYLIVLQDRFELFIDDSKISAPIKTSLVANGGQLSPYLGTSSALTNIVNNTSGKIWFSNTCNYALVRIVPEKRCIVKLTPIAMMKAVKNSVEAEGMRSALIRDAAAIARFLNWIEIEMEKGTVISEISAADKLLGFRMQNKYFLTTSFESISATGSHGAIIHYRPTPVSNAIIEKEDVYLIDSGAIYKDGTTDITRTVHFGTPTERQRDAYTRVLKGQIAIVTSTFPKGIRASRIDSFARRALWNVGLDYNHGTGHGIGHALNVHEGPSHIKERYVPDDQGFRANMFTSNEPGYYEEGAYGIRLENIIRVTNVTLPNNFNNLGFLGFEDLTFVPYQHKLIKVELLTSVEIEYLNTYQESCRKIIAEYIAQENPADPAYDWIMKETEPFQH